MRTEETIFNSLVAGDFVCPCGIQCIAYNKTKVGLRKYYTDDITGQIHHEKYEDFLECLKYSVIKEVLVAIYCYKVMRLEGIQIRSLPRGSENLLRGGYIDQSEILSYCNKCDSQFFRKFQLADNSEDLRKIVYSRLFEICKYLVEVK
jgi:hypothetical protein